MYNKKFKELSSDELSEVITRYVDQNRYEHYPPTGKSKTQLLNWFENTYYNRSEIKEYFEFWYN